MTYSIKDRNGQDYEIKDIERFAKHISKNHSSGISIHEENGYYFTVDDAFREKILKFAKICGSVRLFVCFLCVRTSIIVRSNTTIFCLFVCLPVVCPNVYNCPFKHLILPEGQALGAVGPRYASSKKMKHP